MSPRKIVAFSVMSVLLPVTVQAEEIGAAYGYTLGMPMRDVQVLSTQAAEYGDTLYVVKPAANTATDSGVQTVLLGTGKDGRHVARIIGRSPPMPASNCFSQLARTVAGLRQRHPDSGYYAMDDNDMIYQQNRSILLSCEEEGGQNRLVIEYRDDQL
jgi:hypothetical protein